MKREHKALLGFGIAMSPALFVAAVALWILSLFGGPIVWLFVSLPILGIWIAVRALSKKGGKK